MRASAAASNGTNLSPATAAPRVLRAVALLALVAALLALRNPALVASPRFWAEEADLLYANAWLLPGVDALWQSTALRSGYLNVFPIVATWIAAKLVEPEYAPVVALLAIAALQGAVFLLALAGPRRELATPLHRGVAAAVLLYFPYHNGLVETWLSVMNASVHLGVAALLVLLADERAESRPWRWLSRAVLALGAVTGPYTFVLAPLFALKWWRRRDRETLVRAAIVGGLAAVQASLAASVLLGAGAADTRELSSFGAARPYVSLVFQFLYPVTGEIPGRLLLAGLRALPESPGLGWGAVAIAYTLLLLVAGAAWATSPRTQARTSLALAAATWLAFTTLFAVKGLAAYRYAVCPAIAFGLLLALAGTSPRGPRALRTLSAMLVLAALASGIVESLLLRGPMTGVGQAAWRDEVARWRSDPDYALRAWPSSVWFTQLAEPGRRDLLTASLAAAPSPQVIEPGAQARLRFDARGLPAYFAIRFDACTTRATPLRARGLAAGGEILFDRRIALSEGCAARDLDSMTLAFDGFRAFSRVAELELATGMDAPDVTLSRFRLASPVHSVVHPLSGD